MLKLILSDNHSDYTITKQSLCMFPSENGINRSLAKHPLVSNRKIEWEDGTIEELKNLERPQLVNKNNEPAVLFCTATRIKRVQGNSFNIHIPMKINSQSKK